MRQADRFDKILQEEMDFLSPFLNEYEEYQMRIIAPHLHFFDHKKRPGIVATMWRCVCENSPYPESSKVIRRSYEENPEGYFNRVITLRDTFKSKKLYPEDDLYSEEYIRTIIDHELLHSFCNPDIMDNRTLELERITGRCIGGLTLLAGERPRVIIRDPHNGEVYCRKNNMWYYSEVWDLDVFVYMNNKWQWYHHSSYHNQH